MKRVLSLVLVLVLALGSVPFAFAEDAAVMTAGETLKGYGLAKGVDAEGNLNEEGMLTRAEMMVMLSRLLGVEEEAMNYAIPSTSKDVEGHWAAKYIAYAEQVGKWTSGVGENMFGSDDKVTTQMVAKFMLTALGHEANWDTAVADATALGLMKGVTAEATADITRGQVFAASLNTIETPKKDSEVKLGVTLGVIKEEVAPVAKLDGAVVDSVKAVASNLVEVNFEDDVAADAAANMMSYGITEKATTSNVIVINGVSVEDEDTVLIETAALKNGAGYTLTIDGNAVNFSGISKDTDVPEVKSVLGTDTGIIEVTFDEALVDKTTAEDIANYSIDKEGTVVKAELQSDRKVVKLFVEGFTTTSSKTLTVENVLSIEKVSMKKTSKVFFTKFDKFAATVTLGTQKSNNVNIVLNVVDAHGIDEASAENVANYVIDGLTVTEAVASKSVSTLDYLDRITLTTSEQTNGKLYSLKVNNLVDGSNAANVMTKEISLSVRGRAADATKPMVKSITAKTTTTVEVVFTELNDLDAATALNPANYELDKTDITILDAKFLDDETDSKTIVLTTSTHPEKVTNFKMTTSNVADEFNNVMKSSSRFFTSAVVDNDKPVISKSLAISDTEVKLTFAKAVEKSVATDPTNYVVDENIGSPTKAELDTTGKIVTLTFENLEANEAYVLTVKNIENLYEVSMDEKEVKFIGLAVGVDKDAPTVDSFYLTNVNELRVIFSEKMQDTTVTITATDAANTITFTSQSLLADGKTMIFKATSPTDLSTKKGDYTIKTFTGAKDLAGNDFDYADISTLELSQVGEGTVEELELLSWAQEDLKTFIFYFDREVAETTATMNTITTALALTLERDEDDYTVVRGKSTTNIDDEFKGTTDLDAVITDLIGVAYPSSKEVEISGGLVDETEPTLLDVRPVSITKVEIEYDEDISVVGNYLYKESTSSTWVAATGATAEDNIVTVTVASMDDSKVYDFKQGTSLAKDSSANKAVNVGTISFVGVETAAASNYFYGVEFVNGNTIKLKSSMKFATDDAITLTSSISPGTVEIATTTTVSAGGATAAVSGAISTVEIKVADFTPFISDSSNKYTVDIAGVSIEFTGIVEKLAKATGSKSVYTASVAAVELALDNYAYDENHVVTLDGVTASGAVTISEAGVVSFTVSDGAATTEAAFTASGSAIKVLVKNGDNVIYYVDTTLANGTN